AARAGPTPSSTMRAPARDSASPRRSTGAAWTRRRVSRTADGKGEERRGGPIGSGASQATRGAGARAPEQGCAHAARARPATTRARTAGWRGGEVLDTAREPVHGLARRALDAFARPRPPRAPITSVETTPRVHNEPPSRWRPGSRNPTMRAGPP